MSDDPGQIGARLPGRIAVVFAGFMHAVVGGFVVGTVRLVPAAAALALGALWTVLAALIWRWRHVRPLIVLGLPFAGALAWWVVVTYLG